MSYNKRGDSKVGHPVEREELWERVRGGKFTGQSRRMEQVLHGEMGLGGPVYSDELVESLPC